jgi:hypothetical protein
MAYNFLNKTTFSDDLAAQQDILSQLAISIDSPEYENIDPDLIQIIDTFDDVDDVEPVEQEEITPDDEFLAEPDENADMELLNMLFSEEEVDNNTSYRRANTVVSNNVSPIQLPVPKQQTKSKYTVPRIWDPDEEEIESYQYGGSTLYANDPHSQYVGLNNPNYNQAVLNLSGTNIIRGLDSYQPVAVTDGSKYQILIGPDDTAKFNGKVYEQKMQNGGEALDTDLSKQKLFFQRYINSPKYLERLKKAIC